MAYGTNIPLVFGERAPDVDKLLRGANPADLPVEQPTTFEFVINLKTAKALGLTVPEIFLHRRRGNRIRPAALSLLALSDGSHFHG